MDRTDHHAAQPDAIYRRLVDNAAIGICLISPSSHLDMVNQAVCDFFGYDAKTLKTKTWQELAADDSPEPALSNCYRLTKQFLHADGYPIWGELSVDCLRDDRGEVEFFIAHIVDVTAEVHTRQQLARRHQQNRALTQRLDAQRERLRSELKTAGAYMSALLPGDLAGTVPVFQHYLPSHELGADCFDYRWVDDDHLAVYLIDVSGHGIAPALEAISVHSLLRSGAFAPSTLLEPDRVLTELNEKFPMSDHGGNYFTMWYGVYQASNHTLRYAGAGHPPALILAGDADPIRLASQSVPVGMFIDTEFACDTCTIPPDSELLLYSDGAFELPPLEGTTWSLPDFVALCAAVSATPGWTLELLAKELQDRTATGLFGDDCSLVLLRFD